MQRRLSPTAPHGAAQQLLRQNSRRRRVVLKIHNQRPPANSWSASGMQRQRARGRHDIACREDMEAASRPTAKSGRRRDRTEAACPARRSRGHVMALLQVQSDRGESHTRQKRAPVRFTSAEGKRQIAEQIRIYGREACAHLCHVVPASTQPQNPAVREAE